MAESMDLGMQVFRVFGGLLIVLAILVGAVLALKRFGPYVHKPSAAGTLEVVSRHYLDPKNSLILLRVQEQHFLVGVSPQGLQMLAPVDFPSCESQREQGNPVPRFEKGEGGGPT